MSILTASSRPAEHAVAAEPLAGLVREAAHDLNNHLATVLGKAEIGLMSEEPARWRRGLEEILEAARAARGVVADLQHAAAWQDGAMQFVPVADVLATAGRLATRRTRRGGMKLEVSGGGAAHAPQAGATLVAILELIRVALEVQKEAGPQWLLSASGTGATFSIVLSTGGTWPADVRAEAARPHTHGGQPDLTSSDGVRWLLAVAASAGARLLLGESEAELRFD
jgi:hypothetical protein